MSRSINVDVALKINPPEEVLQGEGGGGGEPGIRWNPAYPFDRLARFLAAYTVVDNHDVQKTVLAGSTVMQPFNVGTAFGETIRIPFRTIRLIGPVALAAAGAMEAMTEIWGPQWVHYDFEVGLTTTGFRTFFAFLGLFVVLMIALVTVATFGAIQDMQGNTIGFREGLTGGVGSIRPVFGPAALVAVIVMVMSVPLVIPGIYVFVVFLVVIPVAAVERTGVWASLRRSFDLALWHWWDLFWLSFFIGLVNGAIGTVARIVTPTMEPVSAFVLGLVLDSLCLAFLAVTPAVAYVHLCRAREGTDPTESAAAEPLLP